MGHFEELRDDLNRANDSAHTSNRLERRTLLDRGLSLGTTHGRVLTWLPVSWGRTGWLLLSVGCTGGCRRRSCSTRLIWCDWHLTIGNIAACLARSWNWSACHTSQIDGILYGSWLISCMVFATSWDRYLAVREELTASRLHACSRRCRSNVWSCSSVWAWSCRGEAGSCCTTSHSWITSDGGGRLLCSCCYARIATFHSTTCSSCGGRCSTWDTEAWDVRGIATLWHSLTKTVELGLRIDHCVVNWR